MPVLVLSPSDLLRTTAILKNVFTHVQRMYFSARTLELLRFPVSHWLGFLHLQTLPNDDTDVRLGQLILE